MAARKVPRNIGLTSSTPAVSPLQVGPVSSEFFGDRRHANATSPIDRADQDSRLFQTIDGNDTFRDGGQENQIKKDFGAPYPFPTPESMKLVDLDKYDSLVDSLDILKHVNTLSEKFQTKTAEPAAAGPIKLQKKAALKSSKPPNKEFKFTREMFMSNNSEAFIQVTHFLFELLDKSESSARFRECWPIYEKKQEGLYRRAALEWFKQLVMANPKWFSKSVKIEQLQGLVVNPYGDRFIKFIHCFVDLVMYTVMKSRTTRETPLMDKPMYTGNSEITKRQCMIMGARIDRLSDLAIDEEIKRLDEIQVYKSLERRMKKKEEETQRKLTEQKRAVGKLVKKRPDFFPENAEELLADESVFVKTTIKDIPVEHRWEALEKSGGSPLYQHVHGKLQKVMKSLASKVDSTLDFIRGHSRFFTLVHAAYHEPNELDLATLYVTEQLKSKQPVNLDDLLDAYSTLIQDSLVSLNRMEVTEDLFERKEMLNRKILLLKKKQEAVEEIKTVDLKELRQHVEFEIRKLEIELEDVDWSVLSGIQDPPLSSMFDFSPTRTLDTNRQTGLTPAISSYLPALDFSKSLECGRSHSLNQSVQSSCSVKTALSLPSTVRSKGVNLSTELSVVISATRVSAGSIPSRRDVRQSNSVSRCLSDQDTCDSPISHLPKRGSQDTGLSVQTRNIRRGNSSKFRLSLPVVEDEEATAVLKKNGVTVSTAYDSETEASVISKNSGESPEFFEISDASEQRINALLKSLADATNTSPEPPALKSRTRRRSSQNFRRDRNSLDLSILNQSSKEDLENKLGIMDVSMSYADFLDLSIEDEGDSEFKE